MTKMDMKAAKLNQGKAAAAAATNKAKTQRRQTKKSQLLKLLRRSRGATIADMCRITTWQAHSVRAALSRLRKQGQDIVRSRDGRGAVRYRLMQTEG